MDITNLTRCTTGVVTSLAYCYFFVSKHRPGLPRLILILPVFYLFTALPLIFSTIHLRAFSFFILTWLANFKLFLFSFDRGPLASSASSSSATSFLRFLSLASLPVKDRAGGSSDHDPTKPSTIKGCRRHPLDLAFVIRTLLLAIIIYLYRYKDHLSPFTLHSLYRLHLYLFLEVLLAGTAALARTLTPLELSPQFREPYRSTSLRDFWGRRWNLVVTSILRPTVYNPVQRWAEPVLGARPARMLGILAAFSVSGLMHEAMFYYMTFAGPTWEVSCYFLVQGVATASEEVVKNAVAPYHLPPVVSGAMTQIFDTMTGFWLFTPPLLRNGMDVGLINEYKPLIQFATNTYQNVKHLLISISAT